MARDYNRCVFNYDGGLYTLDEELITPPWMIRTRTDGELNDLTTEQADKDTRQDGHQS